MRLDTTKIGKGWEVLHLANPSPENASIYGVFLLESDPLEFLVLGGAIGDATCLTRICTFTTNIDNFSDSNFTLMRRTDIDNHNEVLFKGDYYENNSFFPLNLTVSFLRKLMP